MRRPFGHDTGPDRTARQSRSGVDLRGQGQAQTASGQTASGQTAAGQARIDPDPLIVTQPDGTQQGRPARRRPPFRGAAFVQALGAMLRLLNSPDGECYAHRM